MTGQKTSRAALTTLLIAGGLTAAFAATVLVRTRPGVGAMVQGQLQSWAARQGATLRVSSMGPAGFTGIRLHDIALDDRRGDLRLRARIDRVKVYPSIRSLLRGNVAVGSVVIEDGDVDISVEPSSDRVDTSDAGPHRQASTARDTTETSRAAKTSGADRRRRMVPFGVTLRDIDVTAAHSNRRLRANPLLIERIDLTVRPGDRPPVGEVHGYGRLPDGVAYSVTSRDSGGQTPRSWAIDTAEPTRVNEWIRDEQLATRLPGVSLEQLTLDVRPDGIDLCGNALAVDSPRQWNDIELEATLQRLCVDRTDDGGAVFSSDITLRSPSFHRPHALQGLSGAYRSQSREATVEGTLVDGRNGRAEFDLRMRRGTDATINLESDGLHPAGFLRLVGLNRWIRVDRVDGGVRATFGPDLRRGTIEGELRIHESSFEHHLLGPDPLRVDRPMGVTWTALADWRHRTFSLPKAEITLAELRPFRIAGSAVAADPGWSFWVRGRGNHLHAPGLREVLPTSLVAPAMGAELRGNVDLSAFAAGHTHYPESLQLDVDIGGAVEVLAESPRSDVPSLASTGPPMPGTTPRHLPLLEPTGWTHLEALPDWLPRVIVAAEDSRFFDHSGFSWRGIRNALVHNLRTNELQRGGSTITQQLAKNLFLSRRRTLNRKIQELWVAWRLESELSKQRILELYLNLVDWGPGVRGLGQAARHYFSVPPEDLTVEQAALLGAILPGPVLYGRLIDQGYLPSSRTEKIEHILSNLEFWGIVTEQERTDISTRVHRGDIGGLDLRICRDQPTAPQDLPTC